MNIAIQDIQIPNNRKRALNNERVADLRKSISEVGLLQPVVLTPDNRLIAGRHRIEAVKALGWTEIAYSVADLDDLRGELAEIDENLSRNNGTELERAEELKRRKELYEALYPQARNGGDRRSEEAKSERNKFVPVPSFAEATAAKVGTSRRTIEQSAQIADKLTDDVKLSIATTPVADRKSDLLTLARQTPAVQRQVADVLVSGGAATVSQALDTMRRDEAAQTPAPAGKYRCIVIDPPWPVKKIEREVRPNQVEALDYPTMTLEEIEALPLSALATEDGCHLYLWTTQKFLPVALRLVEAWGFRYQCLMTWVKPGGMTPYSWMYNTEHVVFARRGNLPLERNGLKLSFEAAATGHSVKPDVFYERVLAASPEPRLDMFARRERDGFSVWGNEVPCGMT